MKRLLSSLFFRPPMMRLLPCVVLAWSASTAHAYLFFIDELSVEKNGNEIFNDPFDDNIPPPSAPNFVLPGAAPPANYFLTGAVGPESNGKLALDRDDAILNVNAEGDTLLFQGALLETPFMQNLPLSLWSDDNLAVTAIFDLTVPTEPGQQYGVRFTDRAPAVMRPGSDLVEVSVLRTFTDQLVVRFLEANFVAGTIDVLGAVPLDPLLGDQIALMLTSPANINAVSASFAYVNGGVQGSSQPLPGSADIFQGEDWTRVQFLARQRIVPEPATLVLVSIGLAGLGFARRRQGVQQRNTRD